MPRLTTPYAEVRMGKNAITMEEAKQFLGWTEVDAGEMFDFRDEAGTAIKCVNNPNRPIRWAKVMMLKQDHLRKRWKLNGETLIIGVEGNVLNGQHTLVSFILACQEWRENPDWKETWPKEPVLEKFIAYNISEDPETVNTLDTAVVRSFADVMFMSSYLEDIPKNKRRKLAKTCEMAVRVLWKRTGTNADAFSPHLTHSEAAAFVERHPRLLQCVRHIWECNQRSQISKYIHPGYAAALMFLQGASGSDPLEYYDATDANENMLTWELWETAEAFWLEIASGSTEFVPVRMALARAQNEGGGSVIERCALVCKAWLLYAQNQRITDEGIALEYWEDDEGFRRLAEYNVTVGGLDVGPTGERDHTPARPKGKRVK